MKWGSPLNRELKELLMHRRTRLVIRWVLGVTFVYASIYKIADPSGFAKIIYGYYLFPDYSINLLAIILPYMELFAGLTLITGLYYRSGAIVISVMLLFFMTAISINLARGHQFDCGCFTVGDAGHTSSAIQILVRNIFLFIMGLYTLFVKPELET